MHEPEMSLSEAAARLKRSYNRTLRLVLIGKLDGWKDDGRWRLAATSVDKFARETQRTPRKVRPHEV